MGRSRTCWLFPSLLGFGLAVLPALSAPAQNQGLVVRDGTLGSATPGVVQPGLDDLGQHADYLIRADLGEQRGGNLFHSFARFSIGREERATFTGQGAPDPGAIDNVISRVTGGDPSEIRGTLRSTIPDADLWLLNPSGVVFGEGAQLDVPGSFHASTGDHLGFEGSLDRFYSDPSRPSVLSTARPEAFGFLGASGAAAIALEPDAVLDVDPGKSLELVGGDISLTDAEIVAPGAHVSLEAQGTIDVSRSTIDVGGESPGSVSIRSGRLVVQGGEVAGEERSLVLAENEGAGPGGLISAETSESVLVDNGLLSVSTHAAGNAGRIDVASPSVTFENGPGQPLFPNFPPSVTQVGASAETVGSGAGGTIGIDAGALTLRNGVIVSAGAGANATGDAGTVDVTGGDVDVSGSSFISAFVFGSLFGSPGNAGTIRMDLTGTLRIDGFERDPNDGLPPYAFLIASAETRATGRIEIEAGAVELVNGGFLNIACFGCTSRVTDPDRPEGAGTVQIKADRFFVAGSNRVFPSAIAAETHGEGDAGSITIEAGSVVLAPGGILQAVAARGSSGNGGRVTIRADSVHIGPHPDVPRAPGRGEVPISGITTSTSGSGDAGTVDIRASESIFVTYEGGPPLDLRQHLGRLAFGLFGLASGVGSATSGGGAGGSVRLAAPDITITDGAIVGSSSIGGGEGGTIELLGDRIRVANGAFVEGTSVPDFLAGTFGGDAGSVTLRATESIEVSGRRPVLRNRIAVEDWSRVSSASLGSGAAGVVTLAAPLVVIDGGAVATTAAPDADGNEGERGGEIHVDAGQLIVRGGGRIDASTFIAGPGGSIDVTASESIVVDGEGSGIASRTGGAGGGGDVSLAAPRIELDDGGELSARSARGLGEVHDIFQGFQLTEPDAATGDAGAVTLVADRLLLDGGTIATNAEAADGGDVTIQAKQLVHLDVGEITAAVRDGAGGNITIDPEVVILQNGSRIVANAGTGSGGNIQVTADNYFAFPGSVVDASSDLGIDGVVEVHAPDVDLAGKITALPTTFLDAASLMRERCAARRSGERAGSFAVRGNGGIPPEPDGWLPASVAGEPMPERTGASSRARMGSEEAASHPPGLSIRALGSCR